MSSPSVRERIASIDLARGLALLGMIVFHMAWDLHAFGLSGLDPGASPGWRALGHTVAGSFLFLSGLGLVISHDRGTPRLALRRIGVIAGAALGVTVATFIFAPGQVVLFGILHCIALSNLLALPLLGAPTPLVLMLACAAFVAPGLTPGLTPDNSPAPLWWLGLSTEIPDTLDVRPLLPWFGLVLLGMVFARHGGLSLVGRIPASRRPLPAALGWAGRHSLAVYLVHQPVLYGLVFLVSSVWPPSTGPNPGETAFISHCHEQCIAAGVDPESCLTLCRCAQERIGRRKFGASTGDRDPLAVAKACVSAEARQTGGDPGRP